MEVSQGTNNNWLLYAILHNVRFMLVGLHPLSTHFMLRHNLMLIQSQQRLERLF